MERAPGIFLALHPDVPTMLLHDALHDGEPEPGPTCPEVRAPWTVVAGGVLAPIEPLPDVREVLGRDADAIVLYL